MNAPISQSHSPSGIRLQKFLAAAGLGSRRECEELIVQGRVYVDGTKVAQMGVRIDPDSQRVTCDGETVRQERRVYYAVHKPKGHVCTNADPAGRARVIDLLARIPQRVYTIGRLDKDSEGLILVTNDGELAARLMHPRYGVERCYQVVLQGHVSRSRLKALGEGIWLSDGKSRASRVRVVKSKRDSSVVEITLREGKNREVRRMLAKLDYKVRRLVRIRFGSIQLDNLRPGQSRKLTLQELDVLQEMTGLKQPEPPSPHRRRKNVSAKRGRTGRAARGKDANA